MVERLVTGLLLVTTMAVFMSSSIEAMQNRGLKIITVTKENLEGEYHDSTGRIHFSSEVRDDDYKLAVTTSEGEPVVFSKKPRGSSMMAMTMGRTGFLVKMNQPGSGLPKYSDYVVPEVFHDQMESALRQNSIPKRFRRHLDSSNTKETLRKAIEELASCSEADLIIEAAKALGMDAGVMGSDSPAARQFYVLAMRLMKIKDSMQGEAEARGYHGYPHSFNQGLHSEWYKYGQKQEKCSKCTTGSCPYYGDRSNECFGMCGYGCYCWSWLCGDCCVHQGCVDHDKCCRRHGTASWECFSVWNFDCSGYSC